MEQPISDAPLFQRGCGCNSSNTSDLPILFTSSSRVLEIHFTAINMTALDDPKHLNFEATYEFIKFPLLCKEVKTLTGTSGTINLEDENVSFLIHLSIFLKYSEFDLKISERVPNTAMDN